MHPVRRRLVGLGARSDGERHSGERARGSGPDPGHRLYLRHRPQPHAESRIRPPAAGFNGILGVGLFAQDCGSGCANSANNGSYYACSGSSCTGTTVALASQVQNPVALLPQDNNGVIVQLPSVPLGGSPSVNGSLVLGIGTQSNNMPSGVTTYAADQSGEFTTMFNGTSLHGFIDSGSNGLFFPSTSLLPNCPSTLIQTGSAPRPQ